MEGQGLGKPTQSRQPFSNNEFIGIMKIIDDFPDNAKSLFCAVLFWYQFLMGARIDDTAKLLKINLKASPTKDEEKYCLMTKLCWSKTVVEERDGKC